MRSSPEILFVAWRSPLTTSIHPVGRLTDSGLRPDRYEFCYVHGAEDAVHDGFLPFPEFPSLADVYYSERLFTLFENRVLQRRRPDYDNYLERLGLNAPEPPEPIVLLGRSGGTRATDKIELVPLPSHDETRGVDVWRFFARGVRYAQFAESTIGELHPGDELVTVPEPDNPADPNAIQLVTRNGKPVGYLPYVLGDDASQLIAEHQELHVYVEQINPPPAPVHQRLLCRLEASAGTRFVPFATKRFTPISHRARPIPTPSTSSPRST